MVTSLTRVTVCIDVPLILPVPLSLTLCLCSIHIMLNVTSINSHALTSVLFSLMH